MKKIALIIVFIFNHCCSLNGQKLNRIEIDSLANYDFEKLYNIFRSDFEDEPNDTVRSGLIVNSDVSRNISLVKSHLKVDTLEILIYQTDPAYHHEYLITILRDKYFIKYRFLISGDTDDDGVVLPIKTKLRLNTLFFLKGREISGYTEFIGRCTGNCNEDTISVKGNFRAIIR